MKHVIMYSGGIGSYMAAKRIIEKHGIDNTILLFSNTMTEDEDLYRFINETTLKLGAQLITLRDGRDIWEVFKDVKYIGNSRIAPCTRILKQEPSKMNTISFFLQMCRLFYIVGIDWTEHHRMEKISNNWLPYTILAPMSDEPLTCKKEILEELERENIKVPRLYTMGFNYNYFGVLCKIGQGHFANLLKKIPERYAYHEKRTGND